MNKDSIGPLFVSIVLAFITFLQWRVAKKQSLAAEKQTQAAEKQAQTAKNQLRLTLSLSDFPSFDLANRR